MQNEKLFDDFEEPAGEEEAEDQRELVQDGHGTTSPATSASTATSPATSAPTDDASASVC